MRSQLRISADPACVRIIPGGYEQFRCLGNALRAGVLLGGANVLAVGRADPARESGFQRRRPVGSEQAGGVHGATESSRCPTRAGRFEIGDRERGIAEHLAPSMQDGLGTVETIRWLPEDLQGVLFHSSDASLLFTDHGSLVTDYWAFGSNNRSGVSFLVHGQREFFQPFNGLA